MGETKPKEDNNGHRPKLEKHELFSLLGKERDNGPTTFEEAVRKTGFGKFNIMLMIFAFTGIFAPMFETTTMSYVFAAAQCDLNLSLQDKGFLNSITFAGMISGSFIWGFLLDTFGRRKLMVYGYFVDAAIVFTSSLSQSFIMLLVCKFLGGFVINGPFSAMAAYLSEFHSSQYRSRIQLANGMFTSFAQIVLPLMAWGILPLPIDWKLFGGSVGFHSWNLFLFITGLCPFVSGVIFFFLPESPKFLMTLGENEKAMKVLQKVYSWNTGNPPEDYPVKELLQEKTKDIDEGSEEHKRTKLEATSEGLKNLKLLFKPPLLSKFILITIVLILSLGSLNIIRLWSPQLFQALEDYKTYHNGSTTYLCTMLEGLSMKKASAVCTTNVDKAMVYINSIMVSSFPVLCYLLTGSVINTLGKKKVLILLAGTESAASFFLYFAYGSVSTTILTAIFLACGNVCNNVIFAIIVDAFPTTVRAFALALIIAIARFGAMGGNMMFPVLLQLGCGPPFWVIGSALAVAALLGFFMPNTENKALL